MNIQLTTKKLTTLAMAALLAIALAPALAASDAESVEALPQQPLFLQDGNQSPLEAPEPLFLGPCSASVDCGDGNTISCTGNNSCQANSYVGKVTCDGNTTYCPNQCQVFLYCECNWATCISTSGNCSSGPGYIQCDGNPQITCSQIDRFCGPPGP